MGIVIVAQAGNLLTALHAQIGKTNKWIIDSEASDQMSCNASLLVNYIPNTENQVVRIVDGTLAEVSGTGWLKCWKIRYFRVVLLVPQLTCNLLSFQQNYQRFELCYSLL